MHMFILPRHIRLSEDAHSRRNIMPVFAESSKEHVSRAFSRIAKSGPANQVSTEDLEWSIDQLKTGFSSIRT